MKATRRENISTVPGHKVARQRTRLLLTPRAVRKQMAEEGRVLLTKFDHMLDEAQADVLERWAANEQVLSGRAKSQSWDVGGGSRISESAPIADASMARLNAHSRIKARLPDCDLEILAAFTAMQNRSEGALSAAQYGMIYCPAAKNKSNAFLRLMAEAAQRLISWKY